MSTSSECRGRLRRCTRSRTRIIGDIPEEITPVVTEPTIHRDYCPDCKKDVERVVPAVPPGSIPSKRYGTSDGPSLDAAQL